METEHKPLLKQRNLHIIFSVTLIAVLGVNSITPVFPLVKEVFGISYKEVGLLISMFTLPGVILSPILGILADRYGRKKILVPSLFLFAIAGTWCGFTRDYDVLLKLRFLQGIGAAAIGALNITLIGDIYSGRDRPTAMGYNASVLSLATAVYPAIGGAIATLGWYYPFYLPILALPVGLFTLFGLESPKPARMQAFSAYFKAAIKSFLDTHVIGLLILSFLTFIILYGSFLVYLPLGLDNRFQARPYEIGIILSFSSITTALVSTQLGKLSYKFSQKILLIAVNGIYIISMVLIPGMPGLWWILLPSGLFGIAQGVNIPTLQTLLAGSAPLEYRAVFLSVNGTVLRLGQTLGPIIMGIVFTSMGMQATFFAGAAVALIMGLIVIWMIRLPGLKRP